MFQRTLPGLRHPVELPPAVGDLERSRQRTEKYHRGILVQTTGQMAHDFDSEGILQAEKRHKERFATLVRQIRYGYPDCLPMGTGACTLCRKCTYPDRPCRHPEEMFTSKWRATACMVNDVAKAPGFGTTTDRAPSPIPPRY